MTNIKVLPPSCLAVTSMRVYGVPEDIMESAAEYLENLGVVLKRKPFAVRAMVASEVVVKCRLYLVSGKIYFEMMRRSGDVVLFIHVWERVRNVLKQFSIPNYEASAFFETPECTTIVAT